MKLAPVGTTFLSLLVCVVHYHLANNPHLPDTPTFLAPLWSSNEETYLQLSPCTHLGLSWKTNIRH